MAASASSGIYVINGFFMSMREAYTKPGCKIHYFAVDWDPSALSWADFRGKTLGATDPAEAAEGSVRRTILQDYQSLGLASQPNVGENGVHASASPFEGLAERLNWLGATLEGDDFGKALLGNGFDKATIEAWTKDPQVDWEGGKASVFDLLEDLNADDCLQKAGKIKGATVAASGARNAAFVFIKPHAVTDAVVALVKDKLAAAGINISSEGEITAEKISSDMLIDNHYYAIANKATLTKPKDLNPPAAKLAEFETMFGLSWAAALEQGLVYNALEASQKLGVDGAALEKRWAECKKSGKLLKFGGGFYAGLVL
eukprot:CAMPEP_0175850258 /NCGR_PEP_ID=MMETSP0107_2-20121207/24989_1 /TAXON_ID=195067 ORGANISM="Goniomonas pacifica, Strain CCMP1869" /NCGR_SAMPLE_ID=MMETSP0107_2 /ASSEMBLY_ACC=CAM_ASM_000203 /LENGTH=314 /DNA_ID=CAMNT_0017165525 /DNA_START=9 /DNA_END=953 /DNA_ORIENTATION=+